MTPDPLPVRDPASFPEAPARPEASVHGVLLAAGTSSRFGDANKLLAPVDGDPIVRRAAAALVDSGVDGVTVVVGHGADRVEAALDGLAVTIRRNDDFAEGQSTSLRVGIEAAVERNADAALVALGDMPHVEPATHDRMLRAYERGVADALAAAFEGTRGNPVLFDASFFDRLVAVSGDVGGREILLSADAAAIETGDPGVCHDVDRPTDLRE
jgi:molybdenum cofactor cytidylyltransferase